MMSKKHEKVCKVLNYIKNLLISVSTESGCVSISDFASLIGVPVGIVGSTIGLQIFVLTAAIKKYKTIIKKRKHDKIVLLANSKLNSIEVLTFQALINLNISHNEFVLINNDLQEFGNMKEEIKNSNNR